MKIERIAVQLLSGLKSPHPYPIHLAERPGVPQVGTAERVWLRSAVIWRPTKGRAVFAVGFAKAVWGLSDDLALEVNPKTLGVAGLWGAQPEGEEILLRWAQNPILRGMEVLAAVDMIIGETDSPLVSEPICVSGIGYEG